MNEDKIVKIKVEKITKKFELMKTRSEKVLNLFNFSNSKKRRSFWALKGVSFEVYAGEAIGIVGLNGSGKSTLLNIVSEIYPATTGTLEINGDTSIISIGAGLKKALTGRDNIRLKLLMSGMSNKQIREVMPEIIGFSELGDFIEQPVKSYSSGMKSKLGFSIMAHTNPDIMIIDEALSVGDSTFAKKSFDKIREFKKQGKTIFFVSHSSSQVKQIADRVIWMHFGEMKEIGPTKEVMVHYDKWQKRFNRREKTEREKYIVKQKRDQETFSALDIAKQQLDKEIQNIDLQSRVGIKEAQKTKVENQRLEKKLTKKTKKQIKNIKFGFGNWLLILALFSIIGYSGKEALVDSQAQREHSYRKVNKENSDHKEKTIKPERDSSKSSSSFEESTSEQQDIFSDEPLSESETVKDSVISNSDTDNGTGLSSSEVIDDSDVVTSSINESANDNTYYQSSQSDYSQPYYGDSSDDESTENREVQTHSDNVYSSVEENTQSSTTSTENGENQ